MASPIQIRTDRDLVEEDEFYRTKRRDWNQYKRNVVEAIHKGNWKDVKKFIHGFADGMTSVISDENETVLFLVIKLGKRLHNMLIMLINDMSQKSIETLMWKQEYTNRTALHVAAKHGNFIAARLLVEKCDELLLIHDKDGHLPVHLATIRGNRKMVRDILWEKTKAKLEPSWRMHDGSLMMRYAINAGLYDIACQLLREDNGLALQPRHAQKKELISPLEMIAQQPHAFPSGMKLGFWQNIVYQLFHKKRSLALEMQKQEQEHELKPFSLFEMGAQQPEEIPSKNTSEIWHRIIYNMILLFTSVFGYVKGIGPWFKNIEETTLLHHHLRELVDLLFTTFLMYEKSEVSSTVEKSLLLASQFGIHELVQRIVSTYPGAVKATNEDNRNALHLAVLYRNENVFNVIIEHHHLELMEAVDFQENNILHLAGNRANTTQLNLVPSAVLQMQRELQWFKEVENLVLPHQRVAKNQFQLKPIDAFYKHHQEMILNEEQWMIGMANSCTVATTIIGTIAFAAAITVPGGNNSEGLPMFSKRSAFLVFAVSNALALVSAVCTLLIFLSILISRYAVVDFLYSLPNKLIMGLAALFFSLASMVISFSATLYLVFAPENHLILFPIVMSSAVPVTLFLVLEFPLLLNMINTTYGPSMFKRIYGNSFL